MTIRLGQLGSQHVHVTGKAAELRQTPGVHCLAVRRTPSCSPKHDLIVREAVLRACGVLG